MNLKKIPVKKYKYKNNWDNSIVKVQITRETELSVFFGKDDRALKTTNYQVYRDTPEEVFDWLEKNLKGERDGAMKRYKYLENKYNKFIKKEGKYGRNTQNNK